MSEADPVSCETLLAGANVTDRVPQVLCRLRGAFENGRCPGNRSERPRGLNRRVGRADLLEIGDQLRAHRLHGCVQDVSWRNGGKVSTALCAKAIGRDDESILVADGQVVMTHLHDALRVAVNLIAQRVETGGLCQVDLISEPKDRIAIIASTLRGNQWLVLLSFYQPIIMRRCSFQPEPKLSPGAAHGT